MFMCTCVRIVHRTSYSTHYLTFELHAVVSLLLLFLRTIDNNNNNYTLSPLSFFRFTIPSYVIPAGILTIDTSSWPGFVTTITVYVVCIFMRSKKCSISSTYIGI